MEVHQLQILRELGDLGSVRAVATSMFVTPSAVSQQLALLQRGVDVPLTRKEGRTLVLTEAGRILANAGAAVIASMADARAAIGNYQNDAAAPVTLAGFHSVGQSLFAPLLARLKAEQGPQLLFSDEDVAQDDFPALTSRYDLVLAHRMDHTPPWPEQQVSVVPLAHEPLDIAVPTGHRLARLNRPLRARSGSLQRESGSSTQLQASGRPARARRAEARSCSPSRTRVDTEASSCMQSSLLPNQWLTSYRGHCTERVTEQTLGPRLRPSLRVPDQIALRDAGPLITTARPALPRIADPAATQTRPPLGPPLTRRGAGSSARRRPYRPRVG